ncbi:hypothetical protein ACQ4PT_060380 [Festuca glaucescens]
MDSENVITAGSLPNDLVVEILCRVPFKSFCRFKCVSKAWLAISSDSHYRQKLPKVPSGLLHEAQYRTDIRLLSLSPNNEEIDGALTFLPHYKHLEFVDCCNGLVLCKYKSSYSNTDTCFVVGNPATREWRALPISTYHRHPYGPDGSIYRTILAFDPSWSAQSFYVFNFHENVNTSWALDINILELFSSDLCTWLNCDTWSWNHKMLLNAPHSFIRGALYVQTSRSENEILVIDDLHITSYGMSSRNYTIKLPHECCRLMDGCFGQSSQSLQCIFPEECGRTVAVFSLDAGRPYKWSLKYRLSMPDALARDDYIELGDDGSQLLRCSYHIVALDFEREVLLLVDKETEKLLSYNINTRKLSEIQDGCLTRARAYYYYVACYSKLPGQDMWVG